MPIYMPELSSGRCGAIVVKIVNPKNINREYYIWDNLSIGNYKIEIEEGIISDIILYPEDYAAFPDLIDEILKTSSIKILNAENAFIINSVIGEMYIKEKIKPRYPVPFPYLYDKLSR